MQKYTFSTNNNYLLLKIISFQNKKSHISVQRAQIMYF